MSNSKSFFMEKMMKKIGLTTTIPVEVIFAAGAKPIDLNNLFIADKSPKAMIETAELDGFPRSLCSWIKGLYTAALQNELDALIGVYEGDCSNTRALMEVLQMRGVNVYAFSYPASRTQHEIEREIGKLAQTLGTSIATADEVKKELYPVRQKVRTLDELTYMTDRVTGFENHLYQVCCSDFNGDYGKFEQELDVKLEEIKGRKPAGTKVRLGYMGVPPIFTDLYDVVEEYEAKIMFNEVQRQFALNRFSIDTSLAGMYCQYTYPYSLNARLEDVKEQISVRKLDGLIHYTQAFCYRGIENIIVKDAIDIPVLAIEGDLPGRVDARTRIRLEAFIDMLRDRKKKEV